MDIAVPRIREDVKGVEKKKELLVPVKDQLLRSLPSSLTSASISEMLKADLLMITS